MPAHVKIIYSNALALFALGAVLYFFKEAPHCVSSYVKDASSLSYNMNFGEHVSFAGYSCTDPDRMTTTRIWGISLAAFAVVLLASTWWLNESASGGDDFEEESD